MRLLSSAVARSAKNNAWNEVFALILLFVGTLLFLALISYNPKDLPSWVPWSYLSPPNRPAQNFIGPLGAIFASVFYFLIGAASYLFATALLGFGAAKLFYSRLRVMRRLPWIILFITSGACLFQWLQLQTRHLQGWKHAFDIPGPGGWVGAVVEKTLLLNSMGKVGSLILLLGIYLATLILMTGLRPIHLVHETVALAGRLSARLHEWRLHRQLRRSDLKGQLEIGQKELAKQRRSIEKQLRKQGAPVPEPAAAFVAPEEFAGRPDPKVVDTTALPNEATRRRPSLAELRGGSEKAKPSAGPTTRTWNAANYALPGLDLLDEHDPEGRTAADPAEFERVQQTLIDTLAQFGIAVAAGDITKGPTITRYEVYPAKGVRVDKIVSLERDLARATRAERINILAPIPGKDTVGIELANSRKVTVTLRELLESTDWEGAKANPKIQIPLALGKDVYGKTIIADLAQMPHLLVAGTTGAGKSVCINALVSSMLFRFTPEELQLHYDRSESRRVAGLRKSSAPSLSGYYRSKKSATGFARIDRGDVTALQDFRQYRRAQHCGF